MDGSSEAQRLREEAEIRERDLRRQREKEEQLRKMAEEEAAQKQRRAEEAERRAEEERQRVLREAEWKKLGSDEIQDLPPVPPPISRDDDPDAVMAWYLDDEASKPTLCLNSLRPGRKHGMPPVKMSELRELGVVVFNVSMNDFSVVKQIVKERNYKHTDEIRVSQTCKDDTFLERWFMEHYTEDEQLRLITDGSCYIDVRSKKDKWIRIQPKAGHLLVIPPGLYHRATLDEDDYVALFRAFCEAPRFVPVYRSDARADSTKARLNYLMHLKKGDVATEAGFRAE